jgi:hypothetical protein
MVLLFTSKDAELPTITAMQSLPRKMHRYLSGIVTSMQMKAWAFASRKIASAPWKVLETESQEIGRETKRLTIPAT